MTIVQDRHGRIEDLKLSLEIESISEAIDDPNLAHVLMECTYLSKGPLFRTSSRQYDLRHAKRVFSDYAVAADGKQVYRLDRLRSSGEVGAKHPEALPTDTRTAWAGPYLVACGLTPPMPHSRGLDGNLLSALRHPQTRLLDKLEVFEGRNCLVLELAGDKRLYLDPKIGYAIAGVVSVGRNGFRTVNSDFKEVSAGFWLPMRVQTRSGNGAPGSPTRTIRVNECALNSGLTSRDFKLDFPPGVRVLDLNIGRYLDPIAKGVSEEYLDRTLATVLEQGPVTVKCPTSLPVASARIHVKQLAASQPRAIAVSDARAGRNLVFSWYWVLGLVFSVVLIAATKRLLTHRNGPSETP